MVISSSSVYSISLLNTILLQYKFNSRTIKRHVGSINKLKNLDEYIGISRTKISKILIVYFFISKSIFGFETNIEVNKDILFSIKALVSNDLDNKSISLPSA